jgi:Mg2+ and Co2+ transporter CorA
MQVQTVSMRFFSFQGTKVVELESAGGLHALDALEPPTAGYLWLSFTRDELERYLPVIQGSLQRMCGLQLVDLHVSDLLNAQLPSHYDFTSLYDMLVFRRLAPGKADILSKNGQGLTVPPRGGPPILRRIDTSPVGFVVLDRLLLSVHPQDCSVRDSYIDRLFTANLGAGPATSATDCSSTGARGIPTSAADLMLRVLNHMVDGFLALRRELSHQLDHWQIELLKPRTRFNNWGALLDARLSLHHLDEICEDQRAAVQNWIEALKTWPHTNDAAEQRERDLLQVRSRDVLEHIERVVHHVRRLEQSAETTVQMHFSVQGSRTNDIMRTLTVLTAIFLPLNLITGFFGMNFDALPLIHQQRGLWWAIGMMVVVAIGLALLFWRKRYIARSPR